MPSKPFAMWALLVFAVPALAAPPQRASAPSPARHGSFTHYTLALTWQPGFCSTDGGCRSNQPQGTLIGLHGLWASRPRSLIAHGVSAPQWWHRGCDYFHHSDRSPHLSRSTRRELAAVMPHLGRSLLRHEYDKHVQCFGFDADAFFRAALRLRRRVLDSGFGRYLVAQARGRRVRRDRLVHAFMQAFDTHRRAALQLRCGKNRNGRTVLTEVWITLRRGGLRNFPRPATLMNAPVAQGDCPPAFRVPAWHA